tara:strand:- start:2075 stop:2188 length:114 start_codon:yes stop_codon:yes gene_type:complete
MSGSVAQFHLPSKRLVEVRAGIKKLALDASFLSISRN